MRTRWALLVSLLLLSQACASDSTAPTASGTNPPPTGADEAISCTWPGKAPEQMDVTYLSGGRLFAISPEGGRRTCLLGSVQKTPGPVLAWGPQAERVLVAPDFAVLPSGREIAPFDTERGASWSKPTGKSILAVTADGRLLKRRTIAPEGVDVSFLRRHDEATYHPAGLHIISVGVDDDGTRGLFMATNQGKDVKQLVIGEDARRVYSVVAHSSGATVMFVADHGSYRDVHLLHLDSLELSTLYKTNDQVVGIVEPAGEGPDAIAVQLGSCDGRTSAVVVHVDTNDIDRVAEPAAGGSIQPVGWLPGDELAVVVRKRGCEGSGDLYIARRSPPNTEQESVRFAQRTDLLARDVQAAGVRVVAPPPPRAPATTTNPPEA